MLAQKIGTRQTQGLVMTPQVQQAIKLLQMSHLELQEYLQTELEINPLLEREGGEGEPILLSEESSPEIGVHVQDFGDSSSGEPISGDVFSAPQIKDSGWLSSVPSSGYGGGGEAVDLLSLVRAESSLMEVLSQQLATTSLCEDDKKIGRYLLEMLDERGYLSGSLDTVATVFGVEEERVLSVLQVMQTFEPSGVMARTLEECLMVQLKEKGLYNEAYALLLSHLPHLAHHDFAALKKICGVSEETLKAMVAQVRLLNPKPGMAFGTLVVQPVVPDVLVRPQADHTWLVELNPDVLPRVLMNQRYYATVVGRTPLGQEDRAFLSQCHANASWLVKSLDQRSRTILSVAQEIVRQQDGFLVHGIGALRPLNLKTVAESLGLHESTVSRAIAHKYLSTPRGIFAMKYFFTTAILSADGGEDISAERIRQKIKSLIEQEKGNILSDDQLVSRLHEEGIDIARRTVAKYREALGIGSSVSRRRLHKTYGASSLASCR